MPKGLLFWIIYVVCVVLWLAADFGGIGGPVVQHLAGGSVIEFILVGLLGWGVFGGADPMIWTVLLIILILILLGGIGGPYVGAPYGYGYGHGGVGLVGIIVIVLVVLLLTGRL